MRWAGKQARSRTLQHGWATGKRRGALALQTLRATNQSGAPVSDPARPRDRAGSETGAPISHSTVAAESAGAIFNLMTRQQVLDLYFMDARSKLIDLAAFMDRVERAQGQEDFRMAAFRSVLASLEQKQTERAKQVLLAFTDPTVEPIAAATTKAACGAWPGSK